MEHIISSLHSQASNNTTILQQFQPNDYPIFNASNKKTIMYTTIFLTALAATGALAQQTLAPNLVAVTLNNQTLGGDTNLDQNNFPQTKAALGGIVGPYEIVTLTLGDDIVDRDMRCQILDTQGHIVRVNRGANLNKSTFSDGNAWTIANGLTEVAAITCPVAAPPGE